MSLPGSLEIVAAEWNRAAESMMARFGTVEGTRLFLKAALNDKWLGDKTAVVSSFGIEAAAPLTLVAGIKPSTPVIMVDTGHLFTLTYKYRDQLQSHLGLTDVRTPSPSPEQKASFNPEGDPPSCCDVVKKDLLTEALKDFSVWISGRKRYQGDARSDIPVVEFSQDKIKINPLALWTEEQVRTFMDKRKIPPHPLEQKGYSSVGCWTCTKPGEGRSGRTFAHGGTECGLHIDGSGI